MKLYNNDELQQMTEAWSHARGILTNGKAETQFLKLTEELGELAAAMARQQDAEAKDAIGDIIVVLTNLSRLLGTDVNTCWNLAYDEIKDRKGYLNELGNFIKEVPAQFDDEVSYV